MSKDKLSSEEVETRSSSIGNLVVVIKSSVESKVQTLTLNNLIADTPLTTHLAEDPSILVLLLLILRSTARSTFEVTLVDGKSMKPESTVSKALAPRISDEGKTGGEACKVRWSSNTRKKKARRKEVELLSLEKCDPSQKKHKEEASSQGCRTKSS